MLTKYTGEVDLPDSPAPLLKCLETRLEIAPVNWEHQSTRIETQKHVNRSTKAQEWKHKGEGVAEEGGKDNSN